MRKVTLFTPSNGNITFDVPRDLEISYNLLNLPMEAVDVSDDETLVEVVYLADGTKLATAVPGEDGLLYIGDVVFNWFSDGTYSFESTPFSMGRIEGNSNGTLRKVFYATDHLGSVRSVIANGNVTGTNDFYPFGMRREYPAQSAAPVTRYLYNGKESLISVSPDILDFGARYYNPAICRWTSIDPLAEKYYSMTPYNYCANSPVVFVDPEGRDWYKDEDGTIIWTECTSQEQLDEAKINGSYFGNIVVVFNGSMDEKLGEGDSVYGEGAVTAQVTVYGASGNDDISHYVGFTLTSNFEKFGAIADGEYNVKYQDPKPSQHLPKQYKVYQGKSEVIDCVEGVNPSPKAYNPYSATQKNAIFIHRTNSKGKAPDFPHANKCVSSGCLLIGSADWDAFSGKIGKNNFKLILNRK